MAGVGNYDTPLTTYDAGRLASCLLLGHLGIAQLFGGIAWVGGVIVLIAALEIMRISARRVGREQKSSTDPPDG